MNGYLVIADGSLGNPRDPHKIFNTLYEAMYYCRNDDHHKTHSSVADICRIKFKDGKFTLMYICSE